jgi:NAD(P)-dependent dehydrogenase (short-subunit alcohol dehydrogenase family)
LRGKRVMVTGAAGTIGSAVARAFASAGARVCLVDLTAGPVEAMRLDLEGTGPHLAISGNLSVPTEIQAVFTSVQGVFGGLDVLVHVAGVLARTALDDVTEEIWDWHIDNNLKATFFVDRAAARLMRAGGNGGRIINFASDAWWTGGLYAATAYAASKGGVVSLSRGLARTLGRDGITVNCVAPGTVDSPMLRSGLSDEQIEHLTDVIPLGRLAQPEDVAAATVFLASDHASFITATTLNVSGGELIY